ncbi:MAG: D-amino-acid dehydrogenase [Thermoleophilaceae bacterium]|nr:D-amino-acid dehydrogenase [Thermoleophilaceae bacterium]
MSSAAESYDVVVVGAGAVGVATAHSLAEAGASVLVIDRGARVASECSHGNAGLIAPSHSVPLAGPGVPRQLLRSIVSREDALRVRPRLSPALARFGWRFLRASTAERREAGIRTLGALNMRSAAMFGELAGAGLEFGYEAAGAITVCRTAERFEHVRADVPLFQSAGVRMEILTAERVAEVLPGRELAGGALFPDDAHCEPDRFVAALAAAASDLGATFRMATRVTGLPSGPGDTVRAVETDSGRVAAESVVLAGGADTPKLARMIGASLPVEAAVGHHVELPGACPQLEIPLILEEANLAVTPLSGRLRLAGGVDFGGPLRPPDDYQAANIVGKAAGYLSGVDTAEVARRWAGARPFSPDDIPIVGRSSHRSNVIYATGHAMRGLTLAPVTGLIVRDLLAGGASDLPVEELSPTRFGA